MAVLHLSSAKVYASRLNHHVSYGVCQSILGSFEVRFVVNEFLVLKIRSHIIILRRVKTQVFPAVWQH